MDHESAVESQVLPSYRMHPGFIWVDAQAWSVMFSEETIDDEASLRLSSQEPVSVIMRDPAAARAWFASLFQMQQLLSELHMYRTTAREIMRCSSDHLQFLEEQDDEPSQTRAAWLARMLHSLLLPTSRPSLSIGKYRQPCKS